MIKSVMEKVNGKYQKRHFTAKEPWYDKECEKLREESFELLSKYRKEGYDSNVKAMYVSANREYTTACKEKRIQYVKSAALNISKIKSPKDWWYWVQQFGTNKNSSNIAISSTIMAVYLSNSLNKPFPLNQMLYACNWNESPILDTPFRLDEIDIVLQKIKVNKAAGYDRLPAEIYKYGSYKLKEHILKLFNKILEDDCDIQENRSIIIQLFKKGDRSSPDCYRGISVGNSIDKMLAMALFNRLNLFAREYKLLNEAQAGFRVNYSTTDNIFNLVNIIKTKWSQGVKKVYCFFVDFRAAFDGITRSALLI